MLHGMALCAGIGGLELGLHAALGGAYRTVCYVEREAYAAGVLAARMATGGLCSAPIWGVMSGTTLPPFYATRNLWISPQGLLVRKS
jgi:site-specific DNA-cytosine methylase